MRRGHSRRAIVPRSSRRSAEVEVSESYRPGRHELRSRLIVGSGKYSSLPLQLEAPRASGAEMITVALRRVDLSKPKSENLLGYIPEGVTVLPNTAGCKTVDDAVTTARLGRELFGHGL